VTDVFADEARRDYERNREAMAGKVRAEEFRQLMSDRLFRRYVWRLLEMAGVFRTSFTGDEWTAFNEGRRSLGLAILSDINAHCPDMYELMVKEANE
jgi:hypothetical protein